MPSCAGASALSKAEAALERELRSHARERQIPADETRRILDILDPPDWGATPPEATSQLRRCHELRTKPLKQFTDGDLRFMIDQQLSLYRLIGLAVMRLGGDPLLTADHYAGDLLASVLRVDAPFWGPQLDLEVATRKIADGLRDRPGLEPGSPELINTFVHEHPRRSADQLSGWAPTQRRR